MSAMTSLCCGYCSAIGLGVGTVRTHVSMAVTFMRPPMLLLIGFLPRFRLFLRLWRLFRCARACGGALGPGLDPRVGVDPDKSILVLRREGAARGQQKDEDQRPP